MCLPPARLAHGRRHLTGGRTRQTGRPPSSSLSPCQGLMHCPLGHRVTKYERRRPRSTSGHVRRHASRGVQSHLRPGRAWAHGTGGEVVVRAPNDVLKGHSLRPTDWQGRYAGKSFTRQRCARIICRRTEKSSIRLCMNAMNLQIMTGGRCSAGGLCVRVLAVWCNLFAMAGILARLCLSYGMAGCKDGHNAEGLL